MEITASGQPVLSHIFAASDPSLKRLDSGEPKPPSRPAFPGVHRETIDTGHQDMDMEPSPDAAQVLCDQPSNPFRRFALEFMEKLLKLS